ncbi:uncharacterized protein DSM5745_02518 [Aspergillus mulundensis]|uniref:Uncharacterized protein n=1 Tax=Aspergillus mulundensis TaxID=1810919 RepID=A0A3D8SWR0_9EURO|nr:hypothetical protein DSM5745_02518 [Aspergillus mulundensis]RDW90743.1 hypothetical protein DSM5745_02518 [Aspergillus mulundensis]
MSQDVISKGIIEEPHARTMFQLRHSGHRSQNGPDVEAFPHQEREMSLRGTKPGCSESVCYLSTPEHGAGRSVDHKSPERHSDLARQLRTALILHQVEQEVASGTARRCKNYQAACLSLDDVSGSMASTLPFKRIVSTVEIVELRGRYLREIEQQNLSDETLEGTVRNLESDISTWFTKWDNDLQQPLSNAAVSACRRITHSSSSAAPYSAGMGP